MSAVSMTEPVGPAAPAGTAFLVFGPYSHGSLLEDVTLFGNSTAELVGSVVTVRVSVIDRGGSPAIADLDAGERIAGPFTLAQVQGAWSLRLPAFRRLLSKRYVAVAFTHQGGSGGAVGWVPGAAPGVRPPVVERLRSREDAKDFL